MSNARTRIRRTARIHFTAPTALVSAPAEVVASTTARARIRSAARMRFIARTPDAPVAVVASTTALDVARAARKARLDDRMLAEGCAGCDDGCDDFLPLVSIVAYYDDLLDDLTCVRCLEVPAYSGQTPVRAGSEFARSRTCAWCHNLA